MDTGQGGAGGWLAVAGSLRLRGVTDAAGGVRGRGGHPAGSGGGSRGRRCRFFSLGEIRGAAGEGIPLSRSPRHEWITLLSGWMCRMEWG
jgi:hypothetical protein